MFASIGMASTNGSVVVVNGQFGQTRRANTPHRATFKIFRTREGIQNTSRSFTFDQMGGPADSDKQTVRPVYPDLVKAPFAVAQDTAGTDN
jgi:hypothetical protein